MRASRRGRTRSRGRSHRTTYRCGVAPQLASFKADYLDGEVDYLLGSLYNGAQLLRSVQATGVNGVTVRTAQIPTLVNGTDGVTFGWAG